MQIFAEIWSIGNEENIKTWQVVQSLDIPCQSLMGEEWLEWEISTWDSASLSEPHSLTPCNDDLWHKWGSYADMPHENSNPYNNPWWGY